jgi:hypothetical protein
VEGVVGVGGKSDGLQVGGRHLHAKDREGML